MITKVVLIIREKNLLCPPPTRTLLTLLVSPYLFITFCICQLYHTAKQPLFVRRSRTREWTNKRPGASSRAKIKCNTWEMREKYAFFSLAIHVAKLSRFARKSHEGALKKKKDFNDFTLTVLKSTTMSTYTRSWYMYTSYNCSTWPAYCTCYLKI